MSFMKAAPLALFHNDRTNASKIRVFEYHLYCYSVCGVMKTLYLSLLMQFISVHHIKLCIRRYMYIMTYHMMAELRTTCSDKPKFVC